MLAPQDDEILLLQIVLREAQRAAPLSMITLRRLSHGTCRDTGILSLVDLSLMGNLLVMVMFAGYENFVSRFGEVTKGNRPDWMGKVGFGALKLKLMTSIIAIAAIHMLEDFMHVAEIDNRELGWGVGILLAFVVSGLLLALMDRLSGSGH